MSLSKTEKLTIKVALAEDIGKKDITTSLAIDKPTKIKAKIIAKQNGILCGMEVVNFVFKQVSKKTTFKALKKDGSSLKKGAVIALVSGYARDVLAAERVALNFLSLLSGVSTATKSFVDKVKGTKAKIRDTRKTTPGLRELEKYAVRVGGGLNHRLSLYGGILVKDNHLRTGKYLKGLKFDEEKIQKLIKGIRKKVSHRVEIEVETLAELRSLAKYKPDVIMLDNFTQANLKKAVNFRNKYFPRIKLDASGRINLKNVRAVALSGVDYISVGMITHSQSAVDFSLEIS